MRIYWLTLALWLGMATAVIGSEYKIVDLGTLGGTTSTAAAINAGGQVAGTSVTSGGATRAFRTAPNSVINPATDNLGTTGGSSSTALGINDLGQVVGWSINLSGFTYAFVTTPNGPANAASSIGAPPNSFFSQALGINNSGIVAGYYNLMGVDKAFVWQSGAFTTLPNHSGQATSIADTGHLVAAGKILSSEPTNRGMIYDSDSSLYDEVAYIAGANTTAAAVNDSRVVVGYERLGTNSHRPWMWANNAFAYMNTFPGDTNTRALAINASGVVVGQSQAGAVRWVSGNIARLVDLLPANHGWTSLQTATGINDSGQIVGTGLKGGFGRAFRLDPCMDISPPTIVDSSLDRTIAVPGDWLTVKVRTSDESGIATVTANSLPLTFVSGDLWQGVIPANNTSGNHIVSIVITDQCGSSTSHNLSYETRPGIVMTNRDAAALMESAKAKYAVTLAGRVSQADSVYFRIDDGSLEKILVNASGHTAQNGWMVKVRGSVQGSGASTELKASAVDVIRLD